MKLPPLVGCRGQAASDQVSLGVVHSRESLELSKHSGGPDGQRRQLFSSYGLHRAPPEVRGERCFFLESSRGTDAKTSLLDQVADFESANSLLQEDLSGDGADRSFPEAGGELAHAELDAFERTGLEVVAVTFHPGGGEGLEAGLGGVAV